MKRQPFEWIVGGLIAGIIALAVVAGTLTLAIIDRERNSVQLPTVSTNRATTFPVETVGAARPGPLATNPSGSLSTSSPSPGAPQPHSFPTAQAPAPILGTAIPANHPTANPVQPCLDCHNPRGGG